MKSRSFVNTHITSIILSGAAFGYFLYFSDPRQGTITISLFLVSLFVLVASTVSLLAHFLRSLVNKNEVLHQSNRASLREGVLAAIYSIAVLGLAGIKLLTWWDALLLALSLILFEVYFSSGKEQVR